MLGNRGWRRTWWAFLEVARTRLQFVVCVRAEWEAGSVVLVYETGLGTELPR